jgi:hypothetical protein
MTNKMYETAKKFGRKYVVPALVGTALYFGSGCDGQQLPVSEDGQQLPVSEETKAVIQREMNSQIVSYRNNLDNIVGQYNSLTMEAIDTFNGAIKDRHFDANEQDAVFAKLSRADSLKQTISKTAKMYGLGVPELDNNGDALYSSLNSVINGMECGGRSLECRLSDQGLSIEVDGRFSFSDILVVPPFMTLFVFLEHFTRGRGRK